MMKLLFATYTCISIGGTAGLFMHYKRYESFMTDEDRLKLAAKRGFGWPYTLYQLSLLKNL